MKRFSHHGSLGFCWLAILCVGCNGAPANRIQVSGKVTFEGQPVPEGTILFSPTGSGHFQSNGIIQDGLYSIAADYGPSLGEYKVQIEGFRTTGVVEAAGPLHANEAASEEVESYLPAEFNSQTTLRVTITAANCGELHFDLN